MVQIIRTDRRTGARHPMSIPIRVSDVGMGSTVNVSASGVAFVIDTQLTPGTVIDFALMAEEGEGQYVLHCGGTVVRAEPRGAAVFAAATIDRLVMRKAGEQ